MASLSESNPFRDALGKKKCKMRHTAQTKNQEAKEILSDQETQLSLGLLVAEHISSKPPFPIVEPRGYIGRY
jgi:hypothetical protein